MQWSCPPNRCFSPVRGGHGSRVVKGFRVNVEVLSCTETRTHNSTESEHVTYVIEAFDVLEEVKNDIYGLGGRCHPSAHQEQPTPEAGHPTDHLFWEKEIFGRHVQQELVSGLKFCISSEATVVLVNRVTDWRPGAPKDPPRRS
ncbi:hypothetical protein TNCV_4141101 [Trichonephila clavipes]|nr:hypothetical protein TNCV_4141101 [Trichonephila clavipes]